MKTCQYCGTVSDDSVTVCRSCGAAEFSNTCSNCGTTFDSGNYCPKCGVKVGTQAKKCPHCGTDFFSNACPNCGYMPSRAINIPPIPTIDTSSLKLTGKTKNKWVAIVLCFFLGCVGGHKFYEGKTALGIIYLFTGGLFCIGWFIDLFVLLTKPENYTV